MDIMPNRITLVVGAAEDKVFKVVQSSVLEKLDALECTTVSFCTLEELYANPSQIFGSLQAKPAANATVNRREINLILLHVGRDSQMYNFSSLLRSMDQMKEALGIWQVYTYLIWMLDECRTDSEIRQKELDVLCSDLDLFSSEYILSDKRSDASPSSFYDRTRAASLLINALMISTPPRGLYTLGIGSLHITDRQISDYTCHRFSEIIQGNRLNISHFPGIDALCSKAFDDGLNPQTLPAYISRLAEEHMVTHFCYVSGQDEMISQVDTPSFIDYSGVLTAWETNMEQLLCQQLFPDAATEFFSENGSFVEFVRTVQDQALHLAGMEQKVPVPMFGQKKRVALAYNDFLDAVNAGRTKCIAMLCEQWIKMAGHLYLFAQNCAYERASLLEPYQQEAVFIEQCQELAPGVIDQINQRIANMILEWDVYTDHFLNGSLRLTAETIQRLMDWALQATNTGDMNLKIINGHAKLSPVTILQEIVSPIEKQAQKLLACFQHAHMPTKRDEFCFFANQFPIGALQDRESSGSREMIQVQNKDYLNVEVVSLVSLTDDNTPDAARTAAGRLTGFAPAFTWISKPQIPSSEVQKPILFTPAYEPEAFSPLSPSEETPDQNAWEALVREDDQGRFLMCCSWKDPQLEQINAFVLQNGQIKGHVTAQKNSYKGYEDISDLVLSGICTLELRRTDTNELLSSITFQGRQTTIQLTRSDNKDFSLSSFCSMTSCTLSSVVDVKDGGIPPDALQEMGIQIDHDVIALPTPAIHHKRQSWDIIVKNTDFSVVLSESAAEKYRVQLV